MPLTDLLPQLSLAEKAALLSGDGDWWTQAVPRLAVPAVELGDGPHGLRTETGKDMVWLPSTCFPTLSALAATWDRDLVREVAAAIGVEARAMGVHLVLGPGVNLKRTPLCGRNFEYPSEDPWLTGRLAAAYVDGLQSTGVGACVKHFAANNQETDRTRVSVEADERTLRELYLAAFEHVVHEADPWALMCSYNRVGGTYASAHPWLLTTVLRDEWGYPGLVVSDWDAVHDKVASVRAGLDLEMPGTGGRTDAEVVEAVRRGELDEADVDRAARRVLHLVDRAHPAPGPLRGLGHRPGDTLTPTQEELLGAAAHHELARRAATASLTLVRNTGVLPLDPSSPARIALVGGYARVPRIQGGGSAGVRPTRVDTPLDALSAALGDRLVTAEGYRVGASDYYQEQPVPTDPDSDEALADEAVALAAGSDVVVAVVGLPLAADSEAVDRTDLALPAAQVSLLRRLVALDVPLVVVLQAGSAVTMDPWHDGTAAVLLTGLAGQGVGQALADVLLGRADPGGRLTETYPLSLADSPGMPAVTGERGHVVYGEGVLIGYRWYDALDRPVRYPFGHGLSYTTFTLDDLHVEVLDAAAGRVRCAVQVTNTGARPGTQVVQVYVGDPESAVHRPVRELKGAVKVALDPGERARAVVELAGRDFAYVDATSGAWRREGGTFVVEVGVSSRDLVARAEIELPDDPGLPPVVRDEDLPTAPVAWAVGGDGPARV